MATTQKEIEMHKAEVMSAVLNYVWGCCVLWNQWAKQFNDVNSMEFQDFVHRTNETAWRYLVGRKTLDGSCSDHECEVAMKAYRLFSCHLEKETTE
jgi:hypothetical protein